MDAGLIAGLNTIKIVNEPTVAAFAANSLIEVCPARSLNLDVHFNHREQINMPSLCCQSLCTFNHICNFQTANSSKVLKNLHSCKMLKNLLEIFEGTVTMI